MRRTRSVIALGFIAALGVTRMLLAHGPDQDVGAAERLLQCNSEHEHKCSESGNEWCCPNGEQCIYDGSGKGGCRTGGGGGRSPF